MPYQIIKENDGYFVINRITKEKMSKKGFKSYKDADKQRTAIEINEHKRKMDNFKKKYDGIFF